jgi:Flp pilus assembly protein TadG
MKIFQRSNKSIDKADGQSTIEFIMIIPVIIVLVLAASQAGYAVYRKNVLQQASREGARIISTTNDNSMAIRVIRNICGAEGGNIIISIDPERASDRKMGDMVTISLRDCPGGLFRIIEKISGKKAVISTGSSMRMECY